MCVSWICCLIYCFCLDYKFHSDYVSILQAPTNGEGHQRGYTLIRQNPTTMFVVVCLRLLLQCELAFYPTVTSFTFIPFTAFLNADVYDNTELKLIYTLKWRLARMKIVLSLWNLAKPVLSLSYPALRSLAADTFFFVFEH